MILPGAGLEHHDDGAARTDAIIGRVIAAKGLELTDCVLRGKVHEATAAAAVILFSAIQKIDVVCRPLPVEADAVGGCKRIDTAKRGQVVGNAKAKSRELNDVAAVGSQLPDLSPLIRVLTSLVSV